MEEIIVEYFNYTHDFFFFLGMKLVKMEIRKFVFPQSNKDLAYGAWPLWGLARPLLGLPVSLGDTEHSQPWLDYTSLKPWEDGG